MSTVRAMAGVRVIHHQKGGPAASRPAARPPGVGLAALGRGQARPEIVAIASSTGGPAALSEIFKRLPADFRLPIVVVQHISPEFLPSLVEWLGTTTPLPVEIARGGGQPLPGHIYFAPGDAHLYLTRGGRFMLDCETRMTYTPSGDVLLGSMAAAYGPRAIGVVLTGMGSDGAHGLLTMHEAGAYTLAQDEATSIVYGMPQEAFALGGTNTILPIQEIAPAILKLCGNEVRTPA